MAMFAPLTFGARSPNDALLSRTRVRVEGACERGRFP